MNGGPGPEQARPRGTRPAARRALAALQARLRQRGIWAGALVIPALGIPVLAAFAQGPQVREQALWLLATLPLAFLSPMPWQWTEEASQLRPWQRALPLHLAWAGLGGAVLTAGILALSCPIDELWPAFLDRFSLAGPAVMVLSVGLGWPMASLERLGAQVRAAAADAQALAWLNHRSPFPPDLLVRHLRRLSGQAERDPADTVEGILLLAQLYRTWLGMTESLLVPLKDERDLLETFLEAEGHRSREEIRCSWEGPEHAEPWRLPPFCLFPVCASLLARGTRDFAFQAREQAEGLELRLRCSRSADEDPLRASFHASARLRDVLGGQARLEWEDASTLLLFLPRVGP